MTHGKFNRCLLTKDGSIYFVGCAKKYMLSSRVSSSDYANEFRKVDDKLFPKGEDDKIVDVTLGKNFIIVVTESGECYGAGYYFYRYIGGCRDNSQRDEDYPYKIKMPDGWKARKVYATCDNSNTAWVTCEDSEGKM